MIDETQSRITRGRRRPAYLFALALVVCALALVACGGDDKADSKDSGSAPTTAAEEPAAASPDAALDEARKPLAEFDGPTEPPGEVPAGKELAVIFPLPAPLPQRASQGVVNAAEAVGWKARLIDGKGTPKGYADAFDQAVTAKVDAIVLVAMPVPLMAEQIKGASEAGIPVVAALPSLAEPEDPAKYGLFDYVRADYSKQGETLAKWVIADAPDGAKAIRLVSPEFPDLSRESEVFEETLKAAGPEFDVVDTVESPVTDILGGPQGVQRLAASMRKNPDAKYIFMLSESWSQILLQAKKLTGRDDITGLGSDGDVTVPLLQKGEKLVMIGPDSLTYGWYAVDALIRAFNDRERVGYEIRSQLVDVTNAKDVDGDGITATYDYAAEWKKLWGVE